MLILLRVELSRDHKDVLLKIVFLVQLIFVDLVIWILVLAQNLENTGVLHRR